MKFVIKRLSGVNFKPHTTNSSTKKGIISIKTLILQQLKENEAFAFPSPNVSSGYDREKKI
jgi:hypothetical protein